MPETSPRVGEFWGTTSVTSGQRLVFQVERIEGNVVTLIYPDGRRLRAPRSHMPNSLWRYEGPAPQYRACFVPSCTEVGQFVLGTESARHHACLQHLPPERIPEKHLRPLVRFRNRTTVYAPNVLPTVTPPPSTTGEDLPQALKSEPPQVVVEEPSATEHVPTRYDMLEDIDV